MGRRSLSYVFALDESGRTPIRNEDADDLFVVGGVVIPEHQIKAVRGDWRKFRGGLPGLPTSPKSKHFIEAIRKNRPQIVDPVGQLMDVIASICIGRDAWPLLAPIGKSSVSPKLLTKTRGGRDQISQRDVFAFLLGSFNRFLAQRGATGWVKSDRLGGGEHTHRAWQESWSCARTELDKASPVRVSEKLKFVDSEKSIDVEIADVFVACCRWHEYNESAPLPHEIHPDTHRWFQESSELSLGDVLPRDQRAEQ